MVSFVNRLKERWKVQSAAQVWLILLVFALTGFSVMFLKRIFRSWPIHEAWWFDMAYYILILPIYNLLLLIYGAIFGQARYFWEFEKRFFARIVSWFRGNKQA